MRHLDLTLPPRARSAETVALPSAEALPRVRDLKHWSGLSSQSKVLLRMSAALLLVMAIAVTGTILHMRQSAIHEAGVQVTKLGVTISEQTARSVQAADLLLQGMRTAVLASGATTPEAFRTFFETEATYRDLRKKNDELPQASAFTIIAADGKLVNSSRSWPVPALDLSDRDYFTYFLNHDDPNMIVSRPFKSRSDGVLTAYLVRRVNAPGGRFIGLVLTALDLSYFQDFYKKVSVDGVSVSLVRADGLFLTRYPPIAQTDFKLPDGAAWYANAARGKALYNAPGLFGGGQQLVSLHALTDYPLVVTVAVACARVLATWQDEAILIGVSALCAIVCVGLLLRALALQLRRLERSELFLVTQNDTLHATQERMRDQAAVLAANQSELAEKTNALETTLETMDQGLLTITADGHVAIYNRRVTEMLDLPPGLLATRPTFADIVAFQRAAGEFDVAGEQVPAFVMSGMVPQEPFRYDRVRPNGRAIEVHSIPLAGGGMVRTFTDISDRRRSEEQVRYFARHDSLTKLANRMVFQEQLEHAIELADRTGRSIAVLYLDLDRFKLVNDTRGHATGDKLLAEVAARLQSAVRATDTVARMGGDEFAVVQPFVDQPANAERLAARLLDLVSRPYEIDGAPALIGVSIGIALYPVHGATAGALLRSADTALYQAKADGRGVFRVFDEQMEAAQRNMFQLEQDLRQALSRDELDLAYQPIVDAATRATLAYEVLLRWNHPTRGCISPAEFIPLAEMSGSILPIGLWVLETACAEAQTWPDDIRVSVNLSPVQFRQGDLVTLVKDALARTGLRADRLSLEVTEGLLLDGTRQVLSTMQELRAIGVRFSLDDFGTAHAGLSYLRSFPFDAIKIDRSFVQEAVTRPESRAIVKTILALGNVMKLNVIAEGVETEEQLKLLQQMRCRQVQGYLTGRPVPAHAAHAQLRLQALGIVRHFAAVTG